MVNETKNDACTKHCFDKCFLLIFEHLTVTDENRR